jgi:flavin-dependent dehydrogenase
MNFDVITVDGVLAGSTLAAELARAGQKVLVLQRGTQFKERVRGETCCPREWRLCAG